MTATYLIARLTEQVRCLAKSVGPVEDYEDRSEIKECRGHEAGCIDKRQSISRKHAESSCSMTKGRSSVIRSTKWPHDKMELNLPHQCINTERGCCVASMYHGDLQ